MKQLSKAHQDWILATFHGDSAQQLIDDLERELNSGKPIDESAVMTRLYKTFGMSAPTAPPKPDEATGEE